MLRIIKTGAAGLVATGAMTAAMELMFRKLPWYQRYPLPPRLITSRVLHRLGLGKADKPATAMVNHFLYGASTAMAYTPITYTRANPLVAGACFGVALWGASYLGWLPAAGILPSARWTPRKRTGLMIAAHVVWGVTLGALAGHSARSR